MRLEENVYEAVIGSYCNEEDYLIENLQIKNEFAEGALCSEYYNRVYEANRRICARLGVDEDADVEAIIDYMFDIMRAVGEKMFEYGSEYGKNCPIMQTVKYS